MTKKDEKERPGGFKTKWRGEPTKKGKEKKFLVSAIKNTIGAIVVFFWGGRKEKKNKPGQ